LGDEKNKDLSQLCSDCHKTIHSNFKFDNSNNNVIKKIAQKIYEYLERRLKNIIDVNRLRRNPAYNGFYILSSVANAPERHEPSNIEILYRVLLTAADIYYNHIDEWVKMMIHAIEATPKFNIHEVAKQYVEKLYIPVLRSRDILSIQNIKQIKPLIPLWE